MPRQGSSFDDIRLRPLLPTVAASITYGCSLCHLRLQELIFVPVHEDAHSGHWALAVICFPV